MHWKHIMLKFFRDIVKSQHGATAVEYGLIAALLVVAMMVGFNNFADSTNGMWNNVSNKTTEVHDKAFSD
jgi:pilus assembly protein Flp/PilA